MIVISVLPYFKPKLYRSKIDFLCHQINGYCHWQRIYSLSNKVGFCNLYLPTLTWPYSNVFTETNIFGSHKFLSRAGSKHHFWLNTWHWNFFHMNKILANTTKTVILVLSYLWVPYTKISHTETAVMNRNS